MKYNTSNLKWGICDKNDRLIAAFDDQKAAATFHQTLGSSPQFSGQSLQIVDVLTGQPVRELETQGSDRVG